MRIWIITSGKRSYGRSPTNFAHRSLQPFALVVHFIEYIPDLEQGTQHFSRCKNFAGATNLFDFVVKYVLFPQNAKDYTKKQKENEEKRYENYPDCFFFVVFLKFLVPIVGARIHSIFQNIFHRSTLPAKPSQQREKETPYIETNKIEEKKRKEKETDISIDAMVHDTHHRDAKNEGKFIGRLKNFFPCVVIVNSNEIVRTDALLCI